MRFRNPLRGCAGFRPIDCGNRYVCGVDTLTREHSEPGLTDWNATLWVDRVTQDKNNGVFHLCPIAL